jgi:hypothetical protein
MAETKPWLSRWAIMALPIVILTVALTYTFALNSIAYDTARQFLLANSTIRQDVGTVHCEVMLPWNMSFHIETHHEHELQSTDGSAIFSVVLFGSRSVGLASMSMAMKDDRWSVATCELRRIGHATERISN